MVSIIFYYNIILWDTTVTYATHRWPKCRYAAHTCNSLCRNGMVNKVHPQNYEFNAPPPPPPFLYANLHTRALTLCCAKRRDSSKCWWTACTARCFSWSWRSCSILSCLSLSIFSLSCLSCLSRSNFSRSWRSRSALSRSFSRSLCCFSSSRASWFCRSLHKNETSIVTRACNKEVRKQQNILHLCRMHCRSTTQIFSQEHLAMTEEKWNADTDAKLLTLAYWLNNIFLTIVSHSFYHFMTFFSVTTNATTRFGNNSFPNSVEFGLRFSFNAPVDKNGCFQNACVLLCVLTMEKVQINKVIEPSLLISPGSTPYFWHW